MHGQIQKCLFDQYHQEGLEIYEKDKFGDYQGGIWREINPEEEEVLKVQKAEAFGEGGERVCLRSPRPFTEKLERITLCLENDVPLRVQRHQ